MATFLSSLLGLPSLAPLKVWLLYANQTENDILLQEELEEIAQHHPDRFKVGLNEGSRMGEIGKDEGRKGDKEGMHVGCCPCECSCGSLMRHV
jgi:ferredoxin-NADP reductase